MQHYWREPQVEEGLRNIILQNRCGNRCTLLCHRGHSELEFLYKPNAQRRHDLAARAFSGRDISTALLRSVRLPELGAEAIASIAYDPFHTVIDILDAASRATNRIHLVNLAEDNAFALAARAPLLLTLRPQQAFTVEDGLLWERFEDRGETIVAFVTFPDLVANRYRVLEDGTHVLQLMEDDVLIIGGEDSPLQMRRLLDRWSGVPLADLLARNEAVVTAQLAAGHQRHRDPRWQRIADLNRRIVWSGLDAGGACFGAINRIYHLLWVRDGSMTACHSALAGDPEAIRIWAPFLLANPSQIRQEDGSRRAEFLQIVGSRWTKSEDDGLFYASWSLFTHFRTTGDDRLLQGPALPLLVDCLDHHLDKCWEDERGLMGSDTLGEDLLEGNPYYGYDTVNGRMARSHHHQDDREPIARCYSLYHQVNTYNVLRMLLVLLAERPQLAADRAHYERLAQRIRHSIGTTFRDQHGEPCSLLLRYRDGREEWRPWGPDVDYWEHAWAVSQGPFFPQPAQQLASAQRVVATWSDYRSYGYCPWNTLARRLAEHGLTTAAYRDLLADEITDAEHCPQKYPMAGALTEYHGAVEGWRALPFSAGSFLVSCASQLLQSQAMGLAVRGGGVLDGIDAFRYRLARISVDAVGEGDDVVGYTLNQEHFSGCLLLPENRLRPGRNELRIERGAAVTAPRIIAADAELQDLEETPQRIVAHFTSPFAKQITLTRAASACWQVRTPDGRKVEGVVEALPGERFVVLHIEEGGVVEVVIERG